MQVRLVVTNEAGKTKRVHLNSDAVIGRSRDCKLRIASGQISRQHCKLTVMDSGVLVRDLRSSNGTYVNGKIIPSDRDVALTPGSRLAIGPFQIAVYYESSNPEFEPPGSTAELPVVQADAPALPSHAERGPAPAPAELSDLDAEEESAHAAFADVPVDDDDDGAVETVVVEPGFMQRAISEQFSADSQEADEEDVAAKEVAEDVEVAAEGHVAAEADNDESTAGEVGEIKAGDDVDEVDADAPAPSAKRKLTSMLGGLLKLGQTGGGKQADEKLEASAAVMTEDADEPVEIEELSAEEVGDAGPIDEPTGEEQAGFVGQPHLPADEQADERNEQYDDEVQYDDEDVLEEGEPEEADFDEDLGEFFQQFET